MSAFLLILLPGRSDRVNGPYQPQGDARGQEEVPLMLREFVVTYFKRVLMIFPIVAVVTLIPPYPLDVKINSIWVFFVILLIPQLVELAVVHQNVRAQQESDAASADDISVPTSRKARRIESRKRDGRYF